MLGLHLKRGKTRLQYMVSDITGFETKPFSVTAICKFLTSLNTSFLNEVMGIIVEPSKMRIF